MTKEMQRLGRLLYPPGVEESRPRTRAECKDGPRPCVFVSCKYNLYLDVNVETGTIKFNFPDVEPEEMFISCALDVAEDKELTLEEVGIVMNLTRERIRQLELKGVAKIRKTEGSKQLEKDIEDFFAGRREQEGSRNPMFRGGSHED